MTENKSPTSANMQYKITKADLPLKCPMDSMSQWNAHPVVFLSLEEGSAKCPYCGTEYLMKE